MRAHTGTRIEDTAALCDRVDQTIRETIPQSELGTIIDNIGLPYSGINLSYNNSGTSGSWDADITVALEKKHRPTDEYIRALRAKLAREFPGVTFYFLPTDIVNQILNFGLPAPLDVQIIGEDVDGNHALAESMMSQLRRIPGAVDLHIQQSLDSPNMTVDVDRTKAQQVGLSQSDVANSVLTSLSGSFQTSPQFWLNWNSGVSYSIAVQTPQYRMDTLQDLTNIPITGSSGAPLQILSNVASVHRGVEPGSISHYDVIPVIDIYGSVDGTDLRSVANRVDQVVAGANKHLPRGSRIVVRGQVLTMRSSTQRTDRWPAVCYCPGVSAHRRQFSIVAGSIRHHRGTASCIDRNCLVSLPDAHSHQCSRLDGFHYVHGCGHFEQHPGGQLCAGGNGTRR